MGAKFRETLLSSTTQTSQVTIFTQQFSSFLNHEHIVYI